MQPAPISSDSLLKSGAPARRGMRALALLSIVLVFAGMAGRPVPRSDAERPFQLPFAEPPGPDTWLLSQPFGNTRFAYTYRRLVYGAGQGLHFGVDFDARCGTPVVAIGDGVVSEIDNAYHGAGPHNLMIDHPNGYASFYGHLLGRPQLRIGQTVRAGEQVGLTGDPDRTCTARPHLHLEIRDSPNHRLAYNPILLIDADWDRIVLAGGSPLLFQQDLTDPARWQTLFDQPEVVFGEELLNDYEEPWPPDW